MDKNIVYATLNKEPTTKDVKSIIDGVPLADYLEDNDLIIITATENNTKHYRIGYENKNVTYTDVSSEIAEHENDVSADEENNE